MKISGIKLEKNLILIKEGDAATGKSQNLTVQSMAVLPLVETLNQHKKNIPLLIYNTAGPSHFTRCVILNKDKAPIEHESKYPSQKTNTITLFPHKYSFKMLQKIAMAISQAPQNCLGLCSSISTISLVVGKTYSDAFLSQLDTNLKLPSQWEKKAESTIVDLDKTIATYREEKIKIYSYQTNVNVCLLKCLVPFAHFDELIQMFNDLDQINAQFLHTIAFHEADNHWQHFIVISDEIKNKIEQNGLFNNPSFSVVMQSQQVDVLYFHGPHFADRYGIFYKAIMVLKKQHIPILLTSCSGATITLIMEFGYLESAINCLNQVFEPS